MAGSREAYVGIDAAKARNAVAIADEGRDGEVRYLGEFDAAPESMRRLVARLAAKYGRLHFCYEAGPTGYGLYRLIVSLGHSCTVVAPSLIPRKVALGLPHPLPQRLGRAADLAGDRADRRPLRCVVASVIQHH